MRKVLKATVTTVTKNVNGNEKECVRLYFQYNKEGKTYEEGNVKIYRRRDTGYVFDWDEMEYFDGMQPSDDELIFDGRPTERGTFCEYIDEDVELGSVYVYWIVKGDSTPAGPLAIKVRDSRIWWRLDKIISEMERLCADFPNVRMVKEGNTVLGKPLYALYVGNRERTIALVGAVHAGESGPEILIPALRTLLARSPKLLDKVGLAVMPVVSADNRDKMAKGHPPYIRKNAAGVDLNRNFDALWETHDESYGLSSYDPESPTYHGAFPNSEPEVQAVVSLVKRAKPVAVFSYHHLCSVTSDRAFIAHETADDGDFIRRSNDLSKIYSDAFRKVLGVPENENAECVPGCSVGSLPSFCYKNGKIPCFDFEMSPTTPSLHPATRDNTTLEILKSATDAHTSGIEAALEFFKNED
jgi:hypothetical protein